jgi:hypothetical protein
MTCVDVLREFLRNGFPLLQICHITFDPEHQILSLSCAEETVWMATLQVIEQLSCLDVGVQQIVLNCPEMPEVTFFCHAWEGI